MYVCHGVCDETKANHDVSGHSSITQYKIDFIAGAHHITHLYTTSPDQKMHSDTSIESRFN